MTQQEAEAITQRVLTAYAERDVELKRDGVKLSAQDAHDITFDAVLNEPGDPPEP